MRIDELFCDIIIIRSQCDGNEDFSFVTADSSVVGEGALYVCLEGSRYDGHSFIGMAAERGAAAAVVSKVPEKSPIPYILVSSTREALARLCNNYYGRPSDEMKYFAVTGTNGKTSVCTILRAVLRDAGIKTAMIGTVGGSMTTPDPGELYPLLRRLSDSGTEAVVMEASSHALALHKLDPIYFEAGMFTNLTKDHGDFHRDMQSYFEAKASLFGRCRRGIFNLDDRYGRLLYERDACSECYGISTAEPPASGAEFTARNIKRSPDEMTYELVKTGSIFRIWSAMPWSFSASNTLMAAACASSVGIAPRDIRSGIASVKCVKGRLELVRAHGRYPGYPRIYIDYAHTPDALENAIGSLRGIMRPGERLTVLFGCGGERDREKRPIMGFIASELADKVIITEDNSRGEERADIIAQIMSGVKRKEKVTVIEERRAAITGALLGAVPGEYLLLAGKGHEEYLIDRSGKHFFSEKAIVESFYEQYGGEFRK